MPFALNFDETPAQEGTGEWAPVSEGWHNVRVDTAEETVASTGTPGIKTRLSVEGGSDAGRQFFATIWVSEKGMGMLRQKLEAMGVMIPQGVFTLNANDLVARRFAVLVAHRTYTDSQGRIRTTEDVKAYDRRSDSGLPTTDWREELPPAPAPEEEPPF